MTNRDPKPWRTTCRCGAKLAYSCEDIVTGRPAEGADFWCSIGDPAKGPHDWGVVSYREGEVKYDGVAS